MIRTAWRLFSGGEVTTRWLIERFGVSKMTACRDMQVLRRAVPTATYEALRHKGRRGSDRKLYIKQTVVRGLAFAGDTADSPFPSLTSRRLATMDTPALLTEIADTLERVYLSHTLAEKLRAAAAELTAPPELPLAVAAEIAT